MDNKTRKGESSPHPFRSTRIFFANGSWFFSTREGLEMGPFPDRAEASAELLVFLHNLATEDQRIDDNKDC